MYTCFWQGGPRFVCVHVITMRSQRTFIAAISVIMLRLTSFLEIMKALNEEMTIFKLIGVRRALDKKIDLDQFLAIFP